MVRITDIVTTKSHIVSKTRVQKAKKKLGRREIALDHAKGAGFGCNCPGKCGEPIPIRFAEELRARLFAVSSEQRASNLIISWLSAFLPSGTHARYTLTDGVTQHHCCAATYYGVIGVPMFLLDANIS